MGFMDELLQTREEQDRVYGVVTGIVKENWDEEHPGQVKVEYFFGEDGKNVSGWVPVAMPYTADGAGMYFLPEIGNEVVIAFQLGDRNCPIVMGSLWNQKVKQPENTAVKENMIKKIRTAAGHEICLGGEAGKETIEIHTPKKLSILLDDENQKVVVTDEKNKNQISLLAKDGAISLDGEKKLELKVGGKSLITLEKDKVTINAGTVEVKAGQSLKLEGQSLNVKGSSVEIKADGSLKAEASGVTQVKGAMVKIN